MLRSIYVCEKGGRNQELGIMNVRGASDTAEAAGGPRSTMKRAAASPTGTATYKRVASLKKDTNGSVEKRTARHHAHDDDGARHQ